MDVLDDGKIQIKRSKEPFEIHADQLDAAKLNFERFNSFLVFENMRFSLSQLVKFKMKELWALNFLIRPTADMEQRQRKREGGEKDGKVGMGEI